jgi:hemerythrin-like domain-containing protein
LAERPLLEGLYRDHRSLATNLQSLHETIQHLSPSPSASADEVVSGRLRGRFQVLYLGLTHHFRQEEQGLYPEARPLISQGARGADVFGQFFAAEAEEDHGCHAVIASRVEGITDLLQEAEQAGELGADQIARLRSIMGLVRGIFDRHADKEDRFIYPMLQQSLDFDQRTRVRQRLQELG